MNFQRFRISLRKKRITFFFSFVSLRVFWMFIMGNVKESGRTYRRSEGNVQL